MLCLQEVPRHPFSGHRVAEFARRCGLMWSGAHRGSGGTTILTSLRVDVGMARHERLRVPRLQRERGYAVAPRCRCRGTRPSTSSASTSALTPTSAPGTSAPFSARCPPRRPLVVAGDLNEGEDGRAWSSLAGRLRPVTEPAPTFTARHPRHRLDVIFAGGPLEALPHRPVRLDPAGLVAASDHLPVWADLDVRALRRPLRQG